MAGLSHQEKGPTRWAPAVTMIALVVLALLVAGFLAGHLLGLF